MARKEAALVWRPIPGLRDAEKERTPARIALFASVSNGGAASAVIEREKKDAREKEAFPSADLLFRHPLAILALVPDGASLFAAAAISGAAAKTVTAPLDRVKLLMQVATVTDSASALIVFSYHRSKKKKSRFLTQISCTFPDYTVLYLPDFLLIWWNNYFNEHTSLLQTHGLRVTQGAGKKAFSFIDVCTSMLLHFVIPIMPYLYSLCIFFRYLLSL